MTPHAVLASAGVGGWIWLAGSAIARGRPAAERVAWGALAACALAWLAMAVGALGIGLLGNPWVPSGIALAAVVAAIVWRRPALRAPRPRLAPLVIGVGAAFLVALPGQRRPVSELWTSHGDMIWHLGWIHQLAAGFSTPGGIYADAPNGYPWLFHALSAWIAQSLPGGAGDAVAVVEWLGLACAGVGTWLLAREVGAGERAAAWSVGIAIAAGGFGSVAHPQSVFETHMHALHFGPFDGEPVPAMTPSLTYLPPMIPRDLGLALTPMILWIVFRAARGDRALWWPAGFATGLAFLIAPLAGLMCAVWIVAIAAAHGVAAAGVLRAAAAAATAAAVWLVPLGLAYRQYHGFVSITVLRFVEPSAAQAVVALGATLPLALAGLALVVRRKRSLVRPLLLLIAVPLTAVGAGVAVADSHVVHTLVTGQGAPTPLVRWLRYMPFLAFALCVPAGIAADALMSFLLARRRRPAAVLVAVAVIVVAVGATATASVSVWRVTYPYLLRCSSLPIDAHTRVAVIGREPVADEMSEALFARTGAGFYFLKRRYVKVRFRTWLDTRRPGQRARRDAIRAAAHGGPVPPGVDVLVVQRGWAHVAGDPVATCTLRGATWDIIPA